MRLAGEGDDKLREQLPNAEPSSAPQIPRGVYMKRVCLCIHCGSAQTVIRGAPAGRKYMHCLRCGTSFKATSPA